MVGCTLGLAAGGLCPIRSSTQVGSWYYILHNTDIVLALSRQAAHSWVMWAVSQLQLATE